MSNSSSSALGGSVSVAAEDIQIATVGAGSIGIDVSIALKPLIAETILFGIFSFLIVLSTCILLRSGPRSVPNMLMALACVVMYAMAATHWALVVHYLFLANKNSKTLQSKTVQCLNNIMLGRSCSVLDNESVSEGLGPILDSCTSTALLVVNILFGDTIVLWRAWILWARNRVIQGISLALILSTLVMSSVNGRNTCRTGFLQGNEFVTDYFGVAAFVLSWATNLWSTGLISYKAWRHRRMIKGNLQNGNIPTRAEKILMLFVDSGVLYCALWTVLVAYILEFQFGITNVVVTDTKWKFVQDVSTLVESGLIDLIGIYPTLLVVLVCLEKTHCERHFTYNNPVPVRPDLPSRRIKVTDTEAMDADVETYGQNSVLVIGPERTFDSRTRSSFGDGEKEKTMDVDDGLVKSV